MSIFKKFMEVTFLTKAMYAVLAVMVVLNFLILPPHPHFGAEKIPGFWAIFGLGVAVALARLAKGAAHTFLGKDVDFYEKHENASASLKEAK
jgi:hypothetical protein